MDRRVFFDRVREDLFYGVLRTGLVQGMTRILDEWERRGLTDLRHLAYMLATTYHETGRTMQPVRESGSDAYLRSKPYWPWYGRGLAQCTWEVNYRRFGCTTADDMLTWPFALRALFDGMGQGVFAGRKLSDYFNAKIDDPVGARHIINGTDRAAMIATYHIKFLSALKAAAVPSVGPIARAGDTPVLDSIVAGVNAAAAAQARASVGLGPVDHQSAGMPQHPAPPNPPLAPPASQPARPTLWSRFESLFRKAA